LRKAKQENDFYIIFIIIRFEKINEAMLTKEKIHYTIDSLPDNLTIDQVIDQMILLDKIEQGIKDVDEGRIYSTEEVKEKLNKWLK
jgi:predicted transcriptional regulator